MCSVLLHAVCAPASLFFISVCLLILCYLWDLLMVPVFDGTNGVKDSTDAQIHSFPLFLDLAWYTMQSFLAFVDFSSVLFTFALSLLFSIFTPLLFFFLSLPDSYHSDKKAGCRYEFHLASSLYPQSDTLSFTQYMYTQYIYLCFYHITK